jgi:cysteinyl-tRNA synthetase
MELRLYDTLTKEKRPLVPLDADNVRMYACGPTVYDFAHIGNGRAAIVFDVLFRVLRHRYGADHVTYVRNITDVDDKINVRAARDYPGVPLNEAIRKVTEETYRQYQDDVTALGCLAPTVQPRATEHIPEMRAIIEKLVAGGFAYVAEDHVLFSPQAMNEANSVMPRYGALSKRSLDEMIAGARVDVAPYKRDKPTSCCGSRRAGRAVGRRHQAEGPGYIECSAMAWSIRRKVRHSWRRHRPGNPHRTNRADLLRLHAWRSGIYNGFLQVRDVEVAQLLHDPRSVKWRPKSR